MYPTISESHDSGKSAVVQMRPTDFNQTEPYCPKVHTAASDSGRQSSNCDTPSVRQLLGMSTGIIDLASCPRYGLLLMQALESFLHTLYLAHALKGPILSTTPGKNDVAMRLWMQGRGVSHGMCKTMCFQHVLSQALQEDPHTTCCLLSLSQDVWQLTLSQHDCYRSAWEEEGGYCLQTNRYQYPFNLTDFRHLAKGDASPAFWFFVAGAYEVFPIPMPSLSITWRFQFFAVEY